MTDEQNNQSSTPFWQRPITRGVINGVAFAILLLLMQTTGVFQEPRPVTEELVTQDVIAGVIFGFLMYAIELWKQQRRLKAEAAAREKARQRQEEDDEDEDDDRPGS